MKKIVIIGGGFAGLSAAKGLGNLKDAAVTIIDRSKYHLFQPLLYQVAMAQIKRIPGLVPVGHYPYLLSHRISEPAVCDPPVGIVLSLLPQGGQGSW